ncbi:MarR family winged helix-turn-helix transcriptional regulator [Nocardiopsis sp. NPDC057823]|uniref:MarR family winged helix-turn-helix transcriptional regulator n=1 Tax=Nocardiopsis sp. NPDC057823 TaxID=3346256 RepID=UPI00366D45BF
MDRDRALREVEEAGRVLSAAAVMFHTAVGERLGIGPSDWKMMDLLERHGPCTAGELVRHSGLAPASVTGVLDRLQRRGMITRGRDESDRRRVVVTLTGVPAERAAEVFGPLMRELGEVHADYDADQLALIAGYLTRAAAAQTRATAEVAGGAEPAGETSGG